MSGQKTKGGSDSCTTKVPVERRKGGSDFRPEAARRHERIPVNEARCGQQAANRMALKEMDKEFFDQRIPVAIVTITDEESEIDLLARSGT